MPLENAKFLNTLESISNGQFGSGIKGLSIRRSKGRVAGWVCAVV